MEKQVRGVSDQEFLKGLFQQASLVIHDAQVTAEDSIVKPVLIILCQLFSSSQQYQNIKNTYAFVGFHLVDDPLNLLWYGLLSDVYMIVGLI